VCAFLMTLFIVLLAWQAFVWWRANDRVQALVSDVRNSRPASESRIHSSVPVTSSNDKNMQLERGSSSPSYSTPPLATPLRDMYSNLKAGSTAGNANAACRLGIELMRCELRRIANQRPPRPVGTESKVAADKAARDEAICAGFDNPDNMESWEPLFRAAVLGHRPSMEVFSRVPPVGLRQTLAKPDAMLAYYQYSVPFLTQLAADGNLKSTEELAHLFAGRSWYHSLGLPGPVAVDYRMAIMYAEIALARNTAEPAKTYFRSFITGIAAKITVEERTAATTQAKAILDSLRDVPVLPSATSGTDRAEICEPQAP
jgi:hypothetical protein